MKRSFLSFTLGLLGSAGLVAATLPAAHAAEGTPLYGGEAASAAGITLGGWGNGKTEETTDEREDTDRTLRISIRDYYQGGRIEFQAPRDLAAVVRKPNAYLALTIKMGLQARQFTITTTGATSAGLGGGRMGGGGIGGGVGGGGMAGGAGAGGTATITLPRLRRLRVVFVGSSRSVEIYSPDNVTIDPGKWVQVGIPLASLKEEVGGAPFRVKRILIGGDSPETIYLARAVLVNDDTEITAKAEAERYSEIKINRPVVFTAEGSAGVTPLKLCWDFDARDGIQEEAIGARVEHSFAKPGRYVVTMTAKPADSAQKRAAVETMEVEVLP